MSRSKFEEWFRVNNRYDVLGQDYYDNLFRIWLAGRESMRDEVCPIIFGQCDSDNVAQRTVDAIRKIEL